MDFQLEPDMDMFDFNTGDEWSESKSPTPVSINAEKCSAEKAEWHSESLGVTYHYITVNVVLTPDRVLSWKDYVITVELMMIIVFNMILYLAGNKIQHIAGLLIISILTLGLGKEVDKINGQFPGESTLTNYVEQCFLFVIVTIVLICANYSFKVGSYYYDISRVVIFAFSALQICKNLWWHQYFVGFDGFLECSIVTVVIIIDACLGVALAYKGVTVAMELSGEEEEPAFANGTYLA